jgi:long-chain acyl-CoA synthetase
MASDRTARPWLKSYPPGVDWYAAIPERPAQSLLFDSAIRWPDRPCLDFLDKRYSYAEVADLVNRAARGLQSQGIGPGDRVGLFLPNTPYFVIFYFAVLCCGATVVNFNPLYVGREIAHQICDSGTRMMVTLDLRALHDKLVPMLADTPLEKLVICRMADILPFPRNLLYRFVRRADIARIPRDGRHVFFADLLRNDGHPDPVAINPASDVAVLQYTGGTTGTPKGAMLTHANVYANAVQSGLWFASSVAGSERMLGVLPLFHVFAMTVVMNLSLLAGAEIILVPRFELKALLALIHQKKPGFFPAVPTIYMAIAHAAERAKYDLSSIRICLSGGAPLPVEVKHAFEAATGCTLVEGYGLTESSPVACCNPLNGTDRPGSIGLPLPRTEIEIVSLEDGETVMPAGERGEVCIRGPQVMMGYWNQPEETARTIRNGRLHTGDIGVVDADGYVAIVDRIKDLILCSGFNVYPRMVEEAIYLHEAVEECIVAGVPDAYRGQSVKAYVKLRAGQSVTAEALIAYLADKLSPIEMPKAVEFRNSLPKTMVGKLSRKAILEEDASRRGTG